MSEVFYKVLEMSLYGSIAILAVLLFRLVFTKCPKRVLILFWIIVGLRLIIPFKSYYSSVCCSIMSIRLWASSLLIFLPPPKKALTNIGRDPLKFFSTSSSLCCF